MVIDRSNASAIHASLNRLRGYTGGLQSCAVHWDPTPLIVCRLPVKANPKFRLSIFNEIGTNVNRSHPHKMFWFDRRQFAKVPTTQPNRFPIIRVRIATTKFTFQTIRFPLHDVRLRESAPTDAADRHPSACSR